MSDSSGFSDEKLNFFKAFGYILMRGLLTAQEIVILGRELEEGLVSQYPGRPFDGSSRYWSRLTDEGTPFAASLMEDPRVLRRAQQIWGDDILGIGIDATVYVEDTDWHSDTGHRGKQAVKFITYLDPVTASTGALRVIPGSHLLEGRERERFNETVEAMPSLKVPCQAIDTEPGDVIAFDIRTYHASFGGSKNRRSFNMDFFANPKTPEEIDDLLQVGRKHARKHDLKRKFNYSRNWLENPRRSPSRQCWIDRFEEIGYLDQPGVGEPKVHA